MEHTVCNGVYHQDRKDDISMGSIWGWSRHEEESSSPSSLGALDAQPSRNGGGGPGHRRHQPEVGRCCAASRWAAYCNVTYCDVVRWE